MDRIRIEGGRRLNGIIPISGAKNAALPLMIASLLTKDTLTLENLPRLADVAMLVRILGNHGVDYMVDGRRPGDPRSPSLDHRRSSCSRARCPGPVRRMAATAQLYAEYPPNAMPVRDKARCANRWRPHGRNRRLTETNSLGTRAALRV